jgi:hypothetical protein
VQRSRAVVLAGLIGFVAAPGPARAEPAIGRAAGSGGDAPDDLVDRPFVVGAGELAARLSLEIDLEPEHVAKPFAIAPDVWYGVTDRLTLGFINSDDSLDQVGATASLCFRGDFQTTCDHLYRGSGLDVRYSWLTGALSVAPHARFVVRDVDPWKPAVTAGALVRWAHGRYAITSDPYFRFGVANTDLGNRTALYVPLWLAMQPAHGWLLGLETGWNSDLGIADDGWHVPIVLEAQAALSARWDAGISGGFPSLLGPQNNAKARELTLSVTLRP